MEAAHELEKEKEKEGRTKTQKEPTPLLELFKPSISMNAKTNFLECDLDHGLQSG